MREKEQQERLRKEKEERERLKKEKEEQERIKKEQEEQERLKKEQEEQEKLKKEQELRKKQLEEIKNALREDNGLRERKISSKPRSTTNETVNKNVIQIDDNASKYAFYGLAGLAIIIALVYIFSY